MFDGVFTPEMLVTQKAESALVGEPVEIKWIHEAQVHLALIWFTDRSVQEINAKPLSEMHEALLYSARRAHGSLIQKDAWPLVNELIKRYAMLHDGINDKGEIVPAHRRVCAETGNTTYCAHFREGKLQDLVDGEAAVQYFDAGCGALITAKSYSNGVFNRELAGEELSRLAEKKAVPLFAEMRAARLNALPEVFRPFVAVAMKSA